MGRTNTKGKAQINVIRGYTYNVSFPDAKNFSQIKVARRGVSYMTKTLIRSKTYFFMTRLSYELTT